MTYAAENCQVLSRVSTKQTTSHSSHLTQNTELIPVNMPEGKSCNSESTRHQHNLFRQYWGYMSPTQPVQAILGDIVSMSPTQPVLAILGDIVSMSPTQPVLAILGDIVFMSPTQPVLAILGDIVYMSPTQPVLAILGDIVSMSPTQPVLAILGDIVSILLFMSDSNRRLIGL